MNIPKAVKNMLKNKNKMCIINESPYGNSETRYNDNVVKYPIEPPHPKRGWRFLNFFHSIWLI